MQVPQAGVDATIDPIMPLPLHACSVLIKCVIHFGTLPTSAAQQACQVWECLPMFAMVLRRVR